MYKKCVWRPLPHTFVPVWRPLPHVDVNYAFALTWKADITGNDVIFISANPILVLQRFSEYKIYTALAWNADSQKVTCLSNKIREFAHTNTNTEQVFHCQPVSILYGISIHYLRSIAGTPSISSISRSFCNTNTPVKEKLRIPSHTFCLPEFEQ